MTQVHTELSAMMALHDSIKRMLPSLESYNDPFIHMDRTSLAEENGPIDQQTAKVLAELDRLLDMLERKRRELASGMIRASTR
ncbi:MAG: hypothetical protein IPF41_03895 [Flavobacteriales bacterium]|nr:hypothetical protein [Flavobacteriales bacterium]